MDRRMAIRTRLTGGRVVAVLRTSTAEDALWIGHTLLDAGWPALEVTWTVPDAAQVLTRLVSSASQTEALVGAGTLRTRESALEALAAGASYLVSPARPAGLAALARHHDLPVVLGALTPHEVHEALAEDADFVKIFPIHRVGGAEYLRDLLAPYPELRAFVSGGIGPESIADHLDSGAQVVSLGQTLYPPDAVTRRDAATIRRLATRALDAVSAWNQRRN
ncbi:MAG: 2-dehydro-3-deoxyphosphogluconate aldolase [Candidatus Sericytochromatia bacterium]|nr:2-dehydro-3-deoxyphosphogluconate aldolase [Candidatus Sericytochromatia bacterium]